MKTHMFHCTIEDAARVDADVVIVGSGVAGIYTALNLDPCLRCVVLNKAGKQHSNSMYAQGGIATVISDNRQQDDPEQHLADTLTAGAGLCDEKAVRILVGEAWSNIQQLIRLQVPFDTNADGNLLLTREGGHHKNRILHCGGDATGLYMTRSLLAAAAKRENIKIYDDIFLSDILLDQNDRVCGVLALDEDERPCYFSAPVVVIASGGIGRVYRKSTNAICATGDGIAAASRAGAALKGMEFVQFHPTALLQPAADGRYFLISEALRGEGAILRDSEGRAFMQGVHPLADLAPRDIVSRAIVEEMRRQNFSHVFLDTTNRPREFLEKRFPTIFFECLHRGLDISREWIPVLPVQHYFMGGIRTDTDARTNLDGLYACGEAACTGVHGANRLASNSLLECLVFGRRCARHINGSDLSPRKAPVFADFTGKKEKQPDFQAYSREIRTLMTQKCGIIRNGKELREAADRIREILDRLHGLELSTKQGQEAYNRAMIAQAVLRASLLRKESVGAHYRSDDPSIGGNEHAAFIFAR